MVDGGRKVVVLLGVAVAVAVAVVGVARGVSFGGRVFKAPLEAKTVRQMSKGYVAIVAHTPPIAPETNATAVGFDTNLENCSATNDDSSGG